MRKIILIIIFTFLGVAHADGLSVKVSGLVCNLCAQGIHKKFSAEAAVKDVDVDMDEMVVSLKFKKGKSLKKERIKVLIEDAGYNVVKFIPEGKK